MSLEFALFDLDGVLVDSRVPISRCMNHALVAAGHAPEPEEALHRWIGPPLDGAFRGILTARGETDIRSDALVALYRERYAEVSLTHTERMPGIVSALDALPEALRIGVATAKPSEFARPILEKLEMADRFGVIQGPALEGSHLEGKAITVGRARAALGCDGRIGAMIGDRDIDVEAGRANDLITIAVAWGIGDRVEFERVVPDHFVETPADLAALLRGLASGP
jgi:phosphoglycolate phosphatase